WFAVVPVMAFCEPVRVALLVTKMLPAAALALMALVPVTLALSNILVCPACALVLIPPLVIATLLMTSMNLAAVLVVLMPVARMDVMVPPGETTMMAGVGAPATGGP